jgi:hypothetical protein
MYNHFAAFGPSGAGEKLCDASLCSLEMGCMTPAKRVPTHQ